MAWSGAETGGILHAEAAETFLNPAKWPRLRL